VARPRHYAWKTESPWFAGSEARLLDGVALAPGERLLEIGCGEGGNLHHLRARVPEAQLYGIDFSPAKAAFAAQATGARVLTADATRLPFADGEFDAVLIRDLLHHLPEPRRAVEEARRVLRSGGRLTLIEPNARAPLVLLQAALLPAERGLLQSRAERLRALLDGAGLRVTSLESRQPFPLARVLLHPDYGAPRLAARPSVSRALDRIEAWAGRAVPRRAWLYLVFQAVKP
jgi:SAM-dependent methyltransferase